MTAEGMTLVVPVPCGPAALPAMPASNAPTTSRKDSLSGMEPASTCPAEALLIAHICGELPAADDAWMESHVAGCAECQMRLDRWREAQEELLRPLRERTAGDVAAATPAALAFLEPEGPARSVRIPGYEILRELHRGGQGIVLLANQASTRRKVAIKVLRDGTLASTISQRRFEREIEIIARLKHPHVVSIFDSGATADGLRFYVMDYIEGVTLREFVQAARPELPALLSLFNRVCEGVRFAHQKGILHRDLKPSNILIDEHGCPRILDFGLARLLDEPGHEQLSMTGQVLGTLPYLAPEQARGGREELDVRTDIYALGVILYELLTGQYPYPVAGQMADVLRNICDAAPSDPSRAWTATAGVRATRRGWISQATNPIDHDVHTIVLKALAKEPGRRYQSVDAFEEDISRFLQGEPISAKRDSAFYVLRKLAARHRLASLVIVCVFCILVSFATIALDLWRETERERGRAKRASRTAADSRDAVGESVIATRALVEKQLFADFSTALLLGDQETAAALRTNNLQKSRLQTAMDFALGWSTETGTIEPQRDPLIQLAAGLRADADAHMAAAVGYYFASLSLGDTTAHWSVEVARGRLEHFGLEISRLAGRGALKERQEKQ